MGWLAIVVHVFPSGWTSVPVRRSRSSDCNKNKPDSCDERPLRRILKSQIGTVRERYLSSPGPAFTPDGSIECPDRGTKKTNPGATSTVADGLNSLIRKILRTSHLFPRLYRDAAISSRSIQDPTPLVWGRVFDPDGPHVLGRSLTDRRLRLNGPASSLWSW